MKSGTLPSPRAALVAALAACIPLAAAPLLGQAVQAPPAPPASTPAVPVPPIDIVELSPFTVTAEEAEDGYIAKQTLAGNRVKTDLKDVGAAIDVLTEKFLNDTGVLDITDALKYVANMSTFDGSIDLNDAHNNSQWYSMAFNARGFRSDTLLVDFFPHPIVPIDRFSTENMTFLRGPNAILFGIGNPGGSIGSTYKRPNLTKDNYSVSHTFGSYDSVRYDVDINKSIIKNRLGIRLAGLDQDRHSFKEPSLNRREAVFGALTFKPWRRTTVTVNVEDGKWERLFELNNLVYDAYTPWALAGGPTVNFLTGAGQRGPGKGNFDTGWPSPFNTYATGSTMVYIEGSNAPIQNWVSMARSASWNDLSVPSADRGQLASKTFGPENNTLRGPDGRTWTLDLTANSWGDTNRHKTIYHAKNLFIEQNIARGLDLELAANEFDVEYVFNAFGNQNLPTIFADPNQLLPDGSPNPNVGRPYLESVRQQIHRERREHANKRATLSYDVDFDNKKIFRNIGFGRYRILGLYEDQDVDTYLAVGRTVNTTPLPGFSPSLNNNQNGIARRYYLPPGGSTFVATGPLDGRSLGTGINIDTVMASESPRRSTKSTESLVGAVQAQWWQAEAGYYRIVGLYGMREDTVDTRAMSFARGANGAYPGDYRDWTSALQSGTWGTPSSITANTKTYSIVVRPLQAVSLFYNYSDLFNSGDPNFRDIFGNVSRQTFGDTNDYGVKLSLFRDRVNVTVTQFETVQFDQTFQSTSNFVQNPNRIWESLPGRESMFIPTFRAYRDDTTKGTELGLAANVTNNWRVRVTGGRQNSTISKYADEVQAYMDTHMPEWQQNREVRLLNPTGSLVTVGDAAAEYQTQIRDARAVIGRKLSNQREYNATLNSSYTFSEGRLKGLTGGIGLRWASEGVLGYVRQPDGRLDIGRPFLGPESFNVDGNLGYTRKLFRDRVRWDIYLNVYNLLDEDGIQPRNVIDAGESDQRITIRRFQIAPRSWQVRNTFTF